MSVADLPLVNACINTCVALLLISGYVLIKRGHRDAHKKVMLAAGILSAIFLASYLTYHALHGSTRFQGQGSVRPVYFTLLTTHTLLAIISFPFVIVTFVRALRGKFAEHRKIATSTWRMWTYVAVTGPLVYLMLYQLYPARPVPLFLEAQQLHKAGDEAGAIAKYQAAANAGHVGAKCFHAVLETRLSGTSTASLVKVLAESPDDVDCLVLLARERLYSNETTAALPLLEQALAKRPDDPFVLASAAFGFFRAQNYERAAETFERSVAVDGNPANVYNAGYAYYLGGKSEHAKPLIERALQLGLEPELAERAKSDLQAIATGVWGCPMHPEVEGVEGDVCP